MWSNNPKDICYTAILKRYIQKLSPGQLRLFCRPATLHQRLQYGRLGWHDAAMSSGQPLGVNAITSLFKEGARIIGLNNPESFSGHALRAYHLSKLYNSPEVSTHEAMCAARHNSVAASLTYISRDKESEAGKFRALHQVPCSPPSPTTTTTTTTTTTVPILAHYIPTNPYSKTVHSIAPPYKFA